MKLYKQLAKLSLIIVLLTTLTYTGSGQSFPSGGFQGGTHGNIKYIKWAGSVDEKWNDAGNWCPAIVPGPDDHVLIPASASTMPEVKTDGLSCKSITMEPGATLTVKPGYTITVNGQVVE